MMRDKCIGKGCGNFNDPDDRWGDKTRPRGCKGDNPTLKWARWYIAYDFTNKEVK